MWVQERYRRELFFGRDTSHVHSVLVFFLPLGLLW